MILFPSVNYIGNKRKLTDWIINLVPKDVKSVTDAFAGGCSVSYAFKQQGYSLISNDSLFSSFVISKALVENQNTILQKVNINKAESFNITTKQKNNYSWLENHLYFPNEIDELARLVQYAKLNLSGYEYYMYLSILRRAMIRKLPYSRMNINWKNIVKLRDEDYSYKKYGRRRAYHNKTFGFHMLDSIDEYNSSVFDSKQKIKSEQLDIIDLLKKYPNSDLLYLDPPYPGTMNNYDGFYGDFDKIFHKNTSHLDLTKKSTFLDNIYKVLSYSTKYKYVMINFNNTIRPNAKELLSMLSYFGNVKIYNRKHNYQVSGIKTKNNNMEKLAIIRMTN